MTFLCVHPLDFRSLLARAPRRTSPDLVRLTLEIRGQTHKIRAASPDSGILGTMPEGFLMLRVVFPRCASLFRELRTSSRLDLRTSLIPCPAPHPASNQPRPHLGHRAENVETSR
jgi:hypothetical protein